jgi:hypothetical protein
VVIRFSDRIGITKIPDALQVEGMTDALRNSLWNHLLRTIFSAAGDECKRATWVICEQHFMLPGDSLPIYGPQQAGWLRNFFFNKDFLWWQVYNLMEFIAENCRSMRSGLTPDKFKEDLNKILEEEMSGYRFVGGSLVPISSPEEISSITSSLIAAQEKELYGTKKHLETALSLMAQKPNPDFRNSIKESISAIESLAKQLTGEDSGGLDKALAKLDAVVQFHGAFKSGLLSLYGYTSDEDGIRHAILEEPDIGLDEAKFMLVICSAFVNFIILKASKHGLL